ncbi:glycosyltransferase family 2 protein [Acinetobacter schindleri]|uniref:glycosyltransferase family A protein n=1 Tax=Acinetobacter schindleri TaxID=108981 RepID=UPI0032B5745A
MLNVITPAFNRAHLLPRLYISLVKQIYKEFTWIIVDDGSSDNTQQVVDGFIEENLINIKYLKISNNGKHKAINFGIDYCDEKYTFIVDSDDWLPETSLDLIRSKILLLEKREDYDSICGLVGLRAYSDGKIIGNTLNKEKIMNYLEYRYCYEIKGDKAEIFKTELLKNNKFPSFEGEKFCAESIVWNKLALTYKMLFLNQIIYYCEYQDDGLTSNSVQLRRNNINGTLNYYSEFVRLPIPLKYRIKGYLNYWRFYYTVAGDILIDKTIDKSLLSILSRFIVYFLVLIGIVKK